MFSFYFKKIEEIVKKLNEQPQIKVYTKKFNGCKLLSKIF